MLVRATIFTEREKNKSVKQSFGQTFINVNFVHHNNPFFVKVKVEK